MEIPKTTKEVLRSQVMAQGIEGMLDQAGAALRLGISVRQVKRLKRRMHEEGVQGLVSKKRDTVKPTHRAGTVGAGHGADPVKLCGLKSTVPHTIGLKAGRRDAVYWHLSSPRPLRVLASRHGQLMEIQNYNCGTSGIRVGERLSRMKLTLYLSRRY